MSNNLSERRLIENEVVFRQRNEMVAEGFKQMHELAQQTNEEGLMIGVETPLHFYCECSDENCRERIRMTPQQYESAHEHRRRFVLLHGHETGEIERIVERKPVWNIVEKLQPVPETAGGLHATEIENL